MDNKIFNSTLWMKDLIDNGNDNYIYNLKIPGSHQSGMLKNTLDLNLVTSSLDPV